MMLVTCIVDVQSPALAKEHHKPQAPLPEADGAWQTFDSRKFRFTASFPGPVFTSSSESLSHKKVTFSAFDKRGLECAVSATSYAEEAIRRKARTKLMTEAAKLYVSTALGNVSSHHFSEIDGRDALEFEFEGHARSALHTAAGHVPDLHGKGLVLWNGDTEYVIVAQSTSSESSLVLDRFIQSFRLK